MVLLPRRRQEQVGELLFKVEAVGGNAKLRRRAALAAAEAIWTFQHPE